MYLTMIKPSEEYMSLITMQRIGFSSEQMQQAYSVDFGRNQVLTIDRQSHQDDDQDNLEIIPVHQQADTPAHQKLANQLQ